MLSTCCEVGIGKPIFQYTDFWILNDVFSRLRVAKLGSQKSVFQFTYFWSPNNVLSRSYEVGIAKIDFQFTVYVILWKL